MDLTVVKNKALPGQRLPYRLTAALFGHGVLLIDLQRDSEQGEYQWVFLEFPQSVKVSELKVQFQGGFSAKTCRLEGCPKGGDFTVISHLYPEDNNSLQISFSVTAANN
ncbi:Nuclear receptor 2C2-associated protein TR4 orphan receptor-associated 16 kDa protein -like protein [Collichthys lucidus]|uniref:Nuclear receptor 2C2-associated protein TR4 orphan receptor-associated 16 kDa protein-like protein n=1 Tax=Collichthys lucidus TaxID=240159 RepID=A0A4U5UK86_COLLU|nr:Nuclear receptor 2C2-associated protein TR4 orphan receptor-associated 16 kDa protein -like protein [Collichthys lucidus]